MRLRYLLWVFLLPWTVAAEDALSDEDIFADGAFDAAVAEGQAASDVNQLVWLGGVSVLSNNALTLTSSTDYGSLGTFSGKAFAKATNPAIGALYVSYTFNHTLWASATDSALSTVYSRAKPDADKPVFQLSEAHLSWDWDKLVFLRLGNQLVDWGASTVWSPADFLNRKSSDPNQSLDTRTGKPGLRVHVPFPGGNVFLFTDLSRSLTDAGVPRDLLKTGAAAFRADAVVAGWNLGVVGNFGQTSDPRLGLTLSGALLGVDLWGEAGGVLPLGDHTASIAASFGGEKTLGQQSEWTFRAEGFWNPDGHADTVLTGPVVSSFTPYYWGRAYAYGSISRQKLLGPDVGATVSGTVNLSDRSWQGSLSLSTSLPKTVPLTLYAQYNGGRDNREFTVAAGQASWTLGVRSFIEF